tara:strand:- start:32 stop:778 length:747 start_codon:yes stop_codon:yes gene_type:complete
MLLEILFKRYLVVFYPTSILVQNKHSFQVSFFEFLNCELHHPKITHYLFSNYAILKIDHGILLDRVHSQRLTVDYISTFLQKTFKRYDIRVLALFYDKKCIYHCLQNTFLTILFYFLWLFSLGALLIIHQHYKSSFLSLQASSAQALDDQQKIVFMNQKPPSSFHGSATLIFQFIKSLLMSVEILFKLIDFDQNTLTITGYIPHHQRPLFTKICRSFSQTHFLMIHTFSFQPIDSFYLFQLDIGFNHE